MIIGLIDLSLRTSISETILSNYSQIFFFLLKKMFDHDLWPVTTQKKICAN